MTKVIMNAHNSTSRQECDAEQSTCECNHAACAACRDKRRASATAQQGRPDDAARQQRSYLNETGGGPDYAP